MVYKLIFLLLITFYVLTGFFTELFQFSSYAFGTLQLVIFSFVMVFIIPKLKVNMKWLYGLILFYFIAILQFFVSSIIYGFEGYERSVFSLFYFITLCLLAPVFYSIVTKIPNNFINKTIRIITIFLLMIGFLAYYLSSRGIIGYKHMILMPEPSHYALILLPFVVYLYMRFDKFYKKILLFMLVSILALLLENTTLLVGNMIFFSLNSFFFANFKQRIYMVVLIVLILIIVLQQDYFSERIILYKGADINNLSALVYLSALERTFLTLEESFLIGAGFNRMGIVTPVGVYQNILAYLGFSELNLKDGAVTGAKLVTEYRIWNIGHIFYFILFVFILELIRNNTQEYY
ncbi:hypothetical protein JCM13991_04650 [Thermodesulfovibrio hydrogeniphilus]